MTTARPTQSGSGTRRAGRFVLAGLVVCVVLAFAVSRVASDQPDGLERVAVDEGFDGSAEPHALGDGPFADYETAEIDDAGTSVGVAGVVGVAVTFAAAAAVVSLTGGRAQRRRARPEAT